MERDMFDTMTLTKLGGALCGTLLVYLLGAWAAETIYHSGGGHGDDHAMAYVVAAEGDDHGGDEVEEVDFSVFMAAANAEDGAGVFRKCTACHSAEAGENGTGPTLYGVVNRAVGSVDGYGYSGALTAVADVWDADHLNGFLEDPKGYAPGTSMGFNGVRKPEDRANLIAYLDSLDD